MLAARVAEGVSDGRRLPQDLLDRSRLRRDVVQRAERIAGCLVARCLVQFGRVLFEPRLQALEVGGPALGVPDRVQLEPVLGRAEPREQRVVELDHLGVERGILRPDRLDVELPVLAVAALLRTAVAVDRFVGVELLGLRLAVEAVL